MDVCLVSMPLADVERPSFAIGLLSRSLRDRGHDVRGVYANLAWLDEVGLDAWAFQQRGRPSDGLTDFIFAAALFRDHDADVAGFVDLLQRRNEQFAALETPAIVRSVEVLRAKTLAFVERIATDILATEPKVVGCTSVFEQHVASLALLAEIKRRAPHVVTLLGGANCETVMGRATHRTFSFVDVVVSGEADHVVGPLVDALLHHGPQVPPLAVPDAVFVPGHRHTGYPTTSTGDGLPRASVRSMDDVSAPDYDDYFAALRACGHAARIVPALVFETSRGCWWGQKMHCTFCGLNGGGMSYASKSPQRVLDEIDELSIRHRTPRLLAADNILDMAYFDEVLPHLEARADERTLFFETKANLRPEQLDQLRRAGVRWIQPGVESLHTKVLRLMRKGSTAPVNVRLLRDCEQRGLIVFWSIIVGFPGEEDAWYAEMADLVPALTHLQPGGFVALRFDRYSPYFNEREARGLSLTPVAPMQHVYPVDEAARFELSYYFEAAGTPERFGNLLHAPIDDRPGAERLRQAMVAWHADRERSARLVATPHESGGATVVDTRAVAMEPTCRLSTDTWTVLRACDQLLSARRLAPTVASEGIDQQRFDAAVADLVRRRFIVELDGKLTPLVLTAPVADLPHPLQFPGGTILSDDLVAAE
jgi:ribosomal peptide maturation radical SAM protein 1